MKKLDKKWKRRIIWALVLLAALAAAIYAWMPSPAEVDLGTVVRGELAVSVDEDGRTRVIDRYIIAAPTAGELERIEFQAGDRVTEGAEVAHIAPAQAPLLDPRSRAQAEAQVAAAQATAQQARAALTQAREASRQAQRELERVEELFAAGLTTEQALDRAQFEAQSAEVQMRSAQAAVRVAEHQVEVAQAAVRPDVEDPSQDRVAVTAPTDGDVLRVVQESGGPVQIGTPLIEVGDASQLEVVVDVLTTSAVDIRPDQLVHIERWGADVPVEGLVRRVEPAAFTQISSLGVEEQRVNVIVDVLAPPEAWQEIGDGYRIEARIITWRGDDILQADASAVFRSGPGWAVFQAVDGRAHLTPVQVGRRTERAVQILDGLKEGDEVVLYPGDAIADGVRITPR